MAEVGEPCEECGKIVFEVVVPPLPCPIIMCACSDLEINGKKIVGVPQ